MQRGKNYEANYNKTYKHMHTHISNLNDHKSNILKLYTYKQTYTYTTHIQRLHTKPASK